MGIEEGTSWDEHWVLYISDESRESTPEPRAQCIRCMLANLTINYIKEKRKPRSLHKKKKNARTDTQIQ